MGDGPAPPLVLASASPRRRELLARFGRAFDVDPADVDETPWPGEDVLDYVARIAEAKAAVAVERHPGRLVVAADTTVELDGVIFGKPVDADDAAAAVCRAALSGREHRVHTHVTVAVQGRDVSWGSGMTVSSTVVFDDLDDATIDRYVATGEPIDKAGAYAMQAGAAPFVREVRGSVTGIIGLPLAELRHLLADADSFVGHR